MHRIVACILSTSIFLVAANTGAPPTSFADDGNLKAGGIEKIIFSGGTGLVATDSAKAVPSSGSCAAGAGGGSSEVTDLGPNDSAGTTSADAEFTFTNGGTYKLCYKVTGGSYEQVGSSLISVIGAPSSFSIGRIWGQSRGWEQTVSVGV